MGYWAKMGLDKTSQKGKIRFCYTCLFICKSVMISETFRQFSVNYKIFSIFSSN